MISLNVKHILISFIYTIIFVYFIPWTDIKVEEFTDLFNYTRTIEYLTSGADLKDFFGISILFSEILWRELLIFLGEIIDDPWVIVSLISSFCLFIYAYIVINKTNNYLLLIFLFNPMFVELIMGQIRIAFAFALLLIAYELIINNKYKSIAIALVIISPLIHTAMLIIIAIFMYIFFFNSWFKNIKFYYIWAILTALIISLLLKFGIDSILVSVEDKRANYSAIISSNNIKYALFWFILSAYIFVNTNTIKKEENNIIIFSLMMMCLFFFSTLLNAYGQRYVAIAIPLILISLTFLDKKKMYLGLSLVFLYQLFQYYYWMKLYNSI